MEYNYVEKTQRKYMLFYYSDRKLLFNPPHSANNDIFFKWDCIELQYIRSYKPLSNVDVLSRGWYFASWPSKVLCFDWDYAVTMWNIFVESMCSHSVTVDGKVVTVHIMDTAWKVYY